jgi:hypothetical protein
MLQELFDRTLWKVRFADIGYQLDKLRIPVPSFFYYLDWYWIECYLAEQRLEDAYDDDWLSLFHRICCYIFSTQYERSGSYRMFAITILGFNWCTSTKEFNCND